MKRQARRVSARKIIADQRQRDTARMRDLSRACAPVGELGKRSLGRELIIVGETALDREETNERFDLLFHVIANVIHA